MCMFGGWLKMCQFCGYAFQSLKVYKQKNWVRTIYYTLLISFGQMSQIEST